MSVHGLIPQDGDFEGPNSENSNEDSTQILKKFSFLSQVFHFAQFGLCYGPNNQNDRCLMTSCDNKLFIFDAAVS